jgi:hypothetical protein
MKKICKILNKHAELIAAIILAELFLVAVVLVLGLSTFGIYWFVKYFGIL